MSADQTRSAELSALADGLDPLCDDFRLAGEKRAAAIEAQSTLRTYASHHEAVEASGLGDLLKSHGVGQIMQAQIEALIVAYAAEREAVKPLKIGDRVEAVADNMPAAYREDWRGWTGWVSAIRVRLNSEELDYEVSDCWPPKHNGDRTDGFNETELVRAALRSHQPAQDGSADRGRG